MAQLTPQQLLAIEVSTRTMSVLSLMGSCFIISTFIFFEQFRRPINRLVFFATFGNILANVATLISTSGIPDDVQQFSPLCEFQGVLIQWFMMADSLWVFCMATNVFLVFWHGYDARQLRYLEKWYLLFAYGVPGIPPLVYIIFNHTSHTRILGPATLWCWVAKDVDWMRIAFFYGPVWIVVSATLTIYIATGLKIYNKGALLRRLRKQSYETNGQRDSIITGDVRCESPAFNEGIRVTTQIHHDVQQHRTSSVDDLVSVSSYSSTRNLSNTSPRDGIDAASPESIQKAHLSCDHNPSMDLRDRSDITTRNSQTGYEATAFAFNQSKDFAVPSRRPSTPATHRPVRPKPTIGNAAAWAYLRVAFLMFMALFVVWVPSTINRLYQFVHKDHPSYALNLISAIVLPLQGAWNATIYVYTTRSECKRAYSTMVSKLTGRAPPYQPAHEVYRKDTLTGSGGTQDSDPEIQLEGMSKQGAEVRHAEVPSHECRVASRPDLIQKTG